MLVKDLKSAPAGRVIISDEKTWIVNPVRNRRKDCYLSLREEDESARILSKTKHPASDTWLNFVTSNGAVTPLIWYPFGYRLTARDYEAKLADKLIPWINNIFDMSSVTVVPQHTHSIEGNLSCKSKKMGPPFSTDASLLDYVIWPHIEVGCAIFVTKTLPSSEHPSTGNEWARAGTTLLKAARLTDAVLRVSSLLKTVRLNKMK